MSNLILFLGGAKSGKTRLAMERASQEPAPRLYIATAQAQDEEMAERIKNHKAERGPEWFAIEEPLNPAKILAELNQKAAQVALLDCLTLWLTNIMCAKETWPTLNEIKTHAENLAQAALLCPCPVIMVSNEVSGGIVPENALARAFKDAAGLTHQIIAKQAREVYLVTAGLPQRLK